MTRPDAAHHDPHATPITGDTPYLIERKVLAGVPCLIERPPDAAHIRAFCIVYHGAWASKEGKLGVYSALTAGGVAVMLPDAALHGERHADTPPSLEPLSEFQRVRSPTAPASTLPTARLHPLPLPRSSTSLLGQQDTPLLTDVLNPREYVWESVRRTVAETPALLDALALAYGPHPVWLVGRPPVWLVGSSMGGYIAQTVGQLEGRVAGVAALITSGVWQEPEVRRAELRAFLDAHRPLTHASRLPPRPLLLASGDADPVFALEAHHQPTAEAYRVAYARAGRPDLLQTAVFPGVAHYTSRRMRDAVLAFVQVGLNSIRAELAPSVLADSEA